MIWAEGWPSLSSQTWDKMAFSGYVEGKKMVCIYSANSSSVNLSEMVNSRLSRNFLNLGFNFFSQKHFVRENNSKVPCSDSQLGSVALSLGLSRWRTRSGRPWNYFQPFHHLKFSSSSGCEKGKWSHWFHPGLW